MRLQWAQRFFCLVLTKNFGCNFEMNFGFRSGSAIAVGPAWTNFVRILLIFGENLCIAYIVRSRTAVRPCSDIQSSVGKPTPESQEKHQHKMQKITAMFVVCRHDLRASELERGYNSGSYQLKPREGPGRT